MPGEKGIEEANKTKSLKERTLQATTLPHHILGKSPDRKNKRYLTTPQIITLATLPPKHSEMYGTQTTLTTLHPPSELSQATTLATLHPPYDLSDRNPSPHDFLQHLFSFSFSLLHERLYHVILKKQ